MKGGSKKTTIMGLTTGRGNIGKPVQQRNEMPTATRVPVPIKARGSGPKPSAGGKGKGSAMAGAALKRTPTAF